MFFPDAFRRRALRPAIVGHRGVRGGAAPENTLEAFDEALRQGADAVELDARPCASGELVVFHDRDLWRTAADPRPVHAVSLTELRRLDLGGGARVPLVAEALDHARAAGLGVNVELKHDAPDLRAAAAALASLLSAWDARHDLVVSSFSPGVLRAHRRLVPRRAHALLVHRSGYDAAALLAARALGFDGVHVQASVVARRGPPAHPRYFAVWTVNDGREARRAWEAGAQAVITDEPARMRGAFEARLEPLAPGA